MGKLICNSVENRETDDCSCCGKVHHEYVEVCTNCRCLNVVTQNMPHTCRRCGKQIETET